MVNSKYLGQTGLELNKELNKKVQLRRVKLTFDMMNSKSL